MKRGPEENNEKTHIETGEGRARPLVIESLLFSDFRNYDRFSLDEPGNLVVFTGKNAVGKTNILEGIQLLTSATSFRHPQVMQLVREGCASSRIMMRAGDGNRMLEVALGLEPGKRRYTVNGKTKAAADVRGLLPAVMFTPDDLQLAKKGSGVKRDSLDDLGMQLTRNYYIVRHDYEKTIRYKNRLLKEEASPDLVASINETLITCGAQLHCLRRALFDRMMPHMKRVYGEISQGGEGLEGLYKPSWVHLGERYALAANSMEGDSSRSPSQVRDVLRESLEALAAIERKSMRSLVGPHADKVEFQLAGRDASAFASQGQQRTIVLAWKMAEVQVVREVLGVAPVLLLDDVLSELDGARREMLVGFVTEDVQTFIAATDLDGFAPELVKRANVVSLPRVI